MKQVTKKQAIAFYETGEWKNWTDAEIVHNYNCSKNFCVCRLTGFMKPLKVY